MHFLNLFSAISLVMAIPLTIASREGSDARWVPFRATLPSGETITTYIREGITFVNTTTTKYFHMHQDITVPLNDTLPDPAERWNHFSFISRPENTTMCNAQMKMPIPLWHDVGYPSTEDCARLAMTWARQVGYFELGQWGDPGYLNPFLYYGTCELRIARVDQRAAAARVGNMDITLFLGAACVEGVMLNPEFPMFMMSSYSIGQCFDLGPNDQAALEFRAVLKDGYNGPQPSGTEAPTHSHSPTATPTEALVVNARAVVTPWPSVN
ncbi:hypothetical protein NKR23_g1241 [Pleurostoma richardsiae]|uniref:Ecp2 effector protein domain-containing protein n=1 Tax=Pleurostoma richardsiae TaxID=41990 RepID=A0AA38SDW2_9PEZI|nr:hypothetical protein NKR23_g1241 [Pleurostoma richardsiae]